MLNYLALVEFDSSIRKQGRNVICGIDEAGRGPIAGPVCAAAVILDENNMIDGLYDSKKVPESKREAMFEEICEKALAYGIAFASVEEIQKLNILNATFLAMSRALAQIKIEPNIIIVDGNQDPGFGAECPTIALVRGDSKSATVAAASILAKVSRDRLMTELDAKYPQYGFANHKGYGTAKHYAALEEFGQCEIHRMKFLDKFFKAKTQARYDAKQRSK